MVDQVYPMFSKVTLKPEAVIGIVGSTNHRVLTVFRKALLPRFGCSSCSA